MFRIIANLLFGEEERPIQDIRSVEEEEEWHVVSHQEAVADEHQKAALLDHQPSSAVVGSQDAENSVISSETQDQDMKNTHQAFPSVLCLPKAVSQATQAAYMQKAKAWADRHRSSGKAVQRQNRIRHSIQQQAFCLHQPSHRNLH
ncbi:hypothetical protein WMY93_016078 [Mugilogobius chulae]|uniref:Uncharacterized protein n=1 Tax=Mugilogobius chulae TaxID=88201 RepID=A0AAW0NWT4_9GOBI